METKVHQFGRPTMVICKYGYEYTLVEAEDRRGSNLPNPCVFGKPGWALKSVKKVGKQLVFQIV